MYIIKNAMKNIARSKVRNILVGTIALVIAVSACVALSIKESAVKTKESTLDLLSVTAEISYDRSSVMSEANNDGSFDRSSMMDILSSGTALTLDEYKKYAAASTVKDSYYSMSASLNGDDSLLPYSEDDETSDETTDDNTDTSVNTETTDNNNQDQGQNGFGMPEGAVMESQEDFKLVGYSGDSAMTDFASDGTCSIISGSVFEEGTDKMVCIISDELAEWNDGLSVGDTIVLVNPENEDETYSLEIVGIYSNSASGSSQGMFSATDPANYIYMSYNTLNKITDASEEAAVVSTDDDGNETTTAIAGSLAYTYTFKDADDYYVFEDEVYDLGLDETYAANSEDISAFEQSMTPLESLSSMATWFLVVVFTVGSIILVVLNIFNIRDRKYEIGVLCAIGMKKGKVALQFICELFTVTLTAILIGTIIGACISVPVTNTLLASQIENESISNSASAENFGRPVGMNGDMTAPDNIDGESVSSEITGSTDSSKGLFGSFAAGAQNYVSSVSYSTDLTVIAELIIAGILLTSLSSLAAVISIMRYEPLKILSNRD